MELVAAICFGLTGCATSIELAPIPYGHPASPAAPAGKAFPLGSMLDTTQNVSTPEHAGHTTPQKAAGFFQCPMHPESRATKPGTCPICGMKLVNRSEEGGHQGGHGQ